MSATLRLLRVEFLEAPHPWGEGVEGLAVYEFQHAELSMELVQPFARGAGREQRRIWGWDGNREAPTLRPSYRARFRLAGRDWELHLHLTGGKIELDAAGSPGVQLR